MRNVFSKVLVATLFVLLMCSVGFAGGIELTDGVVTGMNLSEVKQEINLDYNTTQKGLVLYRRYTFVEGEKKYYNSYYFFNNDTKELIYKLMMREGEPEKKVENLEESATSHVIDGGTHFFSKEGSDLGYKIMDNEAGDGEYQLWVGSISLWDELAESNTLNTFEKE